MSKEAKRGPMTGFQLMQYSIRRITSNFYEALAISGVLWIGILILQLVLLPQVGADSAGDTLEVETGDFFRSLVVFLIAMVVTCWIAVEWHRFILERKQPTTVIPQWSGGRVINYLLLSLLLGVIIGVAFSMAFLMLANVLGQAALQSLGLLFLFALLGLPMFYLFLRWSPVLTMAAIGEKCKLSDAWHMTSDHGAAIFQAAILNIGLVLVLSLPSGLMGSGVFAVLYSMVTGWIGMMVGVSLLTAIYQLAKGELS